MINRLQAETMRNILRDTISKIEEVDVGLGKFSSMEEKTTMITTKKNGDTDAHVNPITAEVSYDGHDEWIQNISFDGLILWPTEYARATPRT